MPTGNILMNFGMPSITVVDGMTHFSINLRAPASVTQGELNENNFLKMSSLAHPLCKIRYVIDRESLGEAEMIILGSPGAGVDRFCQQDLADGSVVYRFGPSDNNWFDFHIELVADVGDESGNKIATGRCAVTRVP